jgi:hypothetical protein
MEVLTAVVWTMPVTSQSLLGGISASIFGSPDGGNRFLRNGEKLYQIARCHTPEDGNHHRQQLFEQHAKSALRHISSSNNVQGALISMLSMIQCSSASTASGLWTERSWGSFPAGARESAQTGSGGGSQCSAEWQPVRSSADGKVDGA